MENNFDQLVVALSKSPLSTDVIYQLTSFIEQQTGTSSSSFVSESFQSLLILEQWAWQLLSEDSLQWINQPYYIQLFHTLAAFNKKLIFEYDNIENDSKVSLLFPVAIDQLNRIFKNIEQSDNNNPYIAIINLWFDNHSYFLHDYLQYNTLVVIDHIGEYFVRNYIMSKQFKFYLSQLREPQITQSIITAKMLFYVKTCSFYLYAYLGAINHNFFYTADEMICYLGEDYLQILQVHSPRVTSWNKEFLSCMAHLIALVCRCYWWGGQTTTQVKLLFPTEQITCECIHNSVRIIAHSPFYEQIETKRSNDETVLLEASLFFLIGIIESHNINWFFRSNTAYQKILLNVAETSINDTICLSVYDIMSIVLTDEQIKELKIADGAAAFAFNILEQARYHPSKMYKQTPIIYILQGLRNIFKIDSLQQKIADLNKISFFVEICDEYPIAFDIIWALSFNQDIQQQLRSSSAFMSKLAHLAKEYENEQMRKMIHGILWNLESTHQDRTISEINNENTFDVMISYSHKDEELCKQIYDELVKSGYRVWIDFDQMHGNVMDAMAQAIEQSHAVIICMSEQYRKSNYCRAEAHYAFQRQCKIVPILSQEHYKPDGWLLFLISQLLYVDFTKYEFNRAIEMLIKELKSTYIVNTNAIIIELKRDTTDTPPKLYLSPIIPKNILDWSQTHVQEWLIGHNLIQMSRLLVDCNGRSLLYFNDYIKNGNMNEMLNLLQEDAVRRTGQTLSLIELSCFRSLIDEQKSLVEFDVSIQRTRANNNVHNKRSFVCCSIM